MSPIAEGVEEALSLDISAALTGIGQLDDALTQVTQSFAVGLADALSTLTNVGADVTPLAESLDVAGLGPAVDTALADATSAPLDVTVDADATPVTDAIDQATSVTPAVTVDADVTQAQDAIGGLADNPIEIPVDADTSQAQDAISALGDSASGAVGSGGSGGSGGEGLLGVSTASEAVAAATGAATGEVGGLTDAFGAFGPEAAGAAAAGAAFAGFLGEAISLAADAEAQQKRFNDTFGASAEIVKNIDVGGLRIDLEDLGKTSGTTNADLEASATRIGLIGSAAGASQPEVAKTTSNILGLAGALAVSNPRFGDAATVADTLSRALSTGRTRSLIPYGIALTQGQIQQEAFNETGKTSADQLTAYDKILAGTTLALQQQGDTLGTTYANGAANAQIQLRALKVQLDETLVKVGTPLLKPTVDTFTALTPAAQQLAVALGQVAEADVPIVQGLIPALEGVAAAMTLVASAGKIVTGASGLPLVGQVAGTLATTLAPPITLMKAFGTGLDLIHGKAKPAADDLRDLSTQLQTVGSGTDLGKLGPAVDDLAKHFSEGSTQAKSFNNSLISLATSGNAAQAEKAVGAITIELEKQGKTGEEIGALFRPYFDALDLITAKNKVAATAVQEAGVTASASAGGYLQLAAAINAGKLSADDASAVAIQLGVSTSDATAFINAQTTAITAQKDKQIEASTAAQGLRSELQAGTITAQQAQAEFANLGISIGGATAFISDAQAEVASMVQTINSGLPTLASAFDAFTTGEKDAFQQLADDAKNGTGSVADDFAALNAASDPATLIMNIQAQTDQINAFLLTIEVLRSQGRERLAAFFAEQGVGSLATAAAAAGDSAVAATEGAAVRLNDAARAKATQLGAELVTGATAAGTTAGTALVDGTASAIGADASAPAAAKAKGDETSAAFNPDIPAKVKEKFGAGAEAITQLTDVQIQAGLIGVQTGEDFAQGLANGIGEKSDVIEAAATAAAQTAERAAKEALKSKSPSQVAHQIGGDFSTGLALGIVDAAPKAADASAVLAASVVRQLQDALAAATSQSSTAVQSAAQSAFTSFVSSAVNSLPSVGAGISKFSSDLASATSAQAAALAGLHKANQDAALDQLRQARFVTLTGIAYGGLTNALNAYNAANALTEQTTARNTAAVDAAKQAVDDASARVDKFKTVQEQSTDAAKQSILVLSAARSNYDAIATSTPQNASKAQKDALAAAKSALSDAEQAFNEFARKLETATTKTADALKTLRQARRTLREAQDELDTATDPATFTKNLRAQTAAGNQFAKDIAKLSREGFTDLAKQLADAGPDAAGQLARGFAANKAKAKSAEAAVDAAGTFATSYQAELTKLFGPSGGAVDAAHTAGQSIGQALTTGLQVSSQAGTAAALANLSGQIAAGIPQVLPLVSPPQVQKALTPVAANAPTVIQTPTLAGAAGSQSLELDLTIVLDDGRTVTAQTSVPFTPAPTRSLKQLVRAQVHAS